MILSKRDEKHRSVRCAKKETFHFSLIFSILSFDYMWKNETIDPVVLFLIVVWIKKKEKNNKLKHSLEI